MGFSKINFGLLAMLSGILTASVFAAGEPTFGKFRQSYSGAVVSFVGTSGTNTAIEVVYDGDTPFRLADVSATVGGEAVGTTTVYRVWQFHRDSYKVVVSTNFFGTAETNSYMQTSEIETITNTVYSSTTDTLPGTTHFIAGDKMVLDFGTQTNVIVRILGTAQ
jgi:hypothetical protein